MWEVPRFHGHRRANGRPTQLSKSVRGTKRWAPSSSRDQQSRVGQIKKDPIAIAAVSGANGVGDLLKAPPTGDA